MKRIKFIILPILFVAVSVLVIAFGFGELNILPDFNLKEIIGASVDVPTDINTNKEIIEQLKNTYLASVGKNTVPEDVYSLWLNIGIDIDVSADEGTEAVKYAIYSECDFYRNFIPDTVFIVPDTEGKFSGLKEPDGTDFDVLGYLLYYVKHIGCTPVLVADNSFIIKNSVDLDKIKHYLEKYAFEGVLLSVDGFYGKNEYVTYTEQLSEYIKNNFSNKYFGVEIHSDFEVKFADKYVSEVFEKKLVDFGYVDIGCTTGNEEFPFSAVALWWNYFGEYYNIPLYCEHRLDLIFSDEKHWSLSTEINSQLQALYDCNYFVGNSFYRVTSLKNKKALARDLAIFLNDVNGTNQDAFYVDSLRVDSGTAYFSGKTASETTKVLCDGQFIKTADCLFSKSFILKPGLNVFEFTANAASYEYNIYNNNSLFSSYYPDGDIFVGSDLAFSPYAVCPENSAVYAVINGNYYSMQKLEVDKSIAVPSGFQAYGCDISFYGKDVYSDELSFVCFYDELAETVNCGSVRNTVSNLQSDDKLSATKQNIGVSAFADNGLGKSLMCQVKYDNTETISEADDYDTYHPYKSSLVAGTLDYIENISVSSGGYLIYELKSGLNVYGVDSLLIYEAFTMPENNISFVDADFSDSTSEDLLFSYDWLAPVTVTQQPLDYKKGYEGFSYNISEYNAQYVDINFYYCSAISSLNFDVSQSKLFSSYEIITDSVNNMTSVRLFLKKAGDFYGFDLIKEQNNSLRISFKKLNNNSLAGKRVMLDAGHGGISMVGTATNDNSVSESRVTLAIALRTKAYLEQAGAEVIMTRVMDSSLSLGERTDFCESMNPDIFVSIHCDGADDLTESGTHTFYYTPYSYPLAECIHNNMVGMYANAIYSVSDENYLSIDRKVKFYPFYVTRVDNCPSVLVETGFLTNFVEGIVLSDSVNQDYLGRAIADGIFDYFGK